MKKLIMIPIVLMLMSACSSLTKKPEDIATKYNIDKAAAKNWDVTMVKVIKGESLIEDWYGAEDPLFYLKKTGTMSENDFQYLETFKTKTITDEDLKNYLEILEKYRKKLPRKYILEDENIKDPKGLVEVMVRESYVRMKTPSSHIAEVVATKEEWAEIVAFSKQDDLSEKDVKRLRKLLNAFIKRSEFYDKEAWFNREVSGRIIEVNNLRAEPAHTSLEMNNVNAKALYIAYPEYFSKLERWKD